MSGGAAAGSLARRPSLVGRAAVMSLVFVWLASGPVDAAGGGQKESAKTQAAKGQQAKQAPEPALTEAGRQTITGDSIAGLRDIAWEELEYYLTSTNPLKRELGLTPLSVLSTDAKALTWMTKLLAGDKEEDVRKQAAEVMDDGRIRQGIPALRVALDDPKGPVALAAAKALWDMEDTSGMPLFREILLGQRKGGDTMIGGQIQDAKRTLHDPKALVMISANEATGILLGPAAVGLKFAEQGMKDSGAVGRAYAATMVGKDKTDSADKVLLEGMKDSSGLVRAAICKSFALRDDTAQLGLVRDTMLDKSPVARLTASAAVLRLTEKPLPASALKKSTPRTSATTGAPANPKSR